MKVRCIANSGKDLSKQALESGHLKTSEYQLIVGDVYTVYGISLWNNVLNYLTMDRYGTLPFWHPAELFSVEESLLPLEWYYQYFGNGVDTCLSALWGYKELVADENHYDELLEREDTAIRIFLKRKREIDENS